LLSVNEAGKNFIKNPTSFTLTKDHDYESSDDEMDTKSGAGKTGALDTELFNILKNLRKTVAKDLNLPPFVIFQDPSIEDMAIQYPITLEEMQQIAGVGAGKAQKYGQEFIELIKKYVEEKEITRPMDMVVKSVVNKSGMKVYFIQSIDRQISLKDIADAKGLEMSQLLDEIESIVQSGTKLNIDYYINDTIDEDKQDDIYEYFREEAETESIDAALEELGEDEYSEEEIRLMRIKFFSELGN
jgi:ATP-dependent DNA helicase RecQ